MLRMFSIILIFYLLTLAVSCDDDSDIKDLTTVSLHLDENLLNYLDLHEKNYFIGPKSAKAHYLEILKKVPNLPDAESHICIDNAEFMTRESYNNIEHCIQIFNLPRIDRLVTGRSERHILVGGHFRTKYNIFGLKKAVADRFANKYLMKNYLLKNNPEILTSKYLYLDKEDAKLGPENLRNLVHKNLGFSAEKYILKPTSAAASKGIQILKNDNNLSEALSAAISSGFRKDKEQDHGYILEEFIDAPVLRMDGYISKKAFINFTFRYSVTPLNFYMNGYPLLEILVKDSVQSRTYDEFAKKVLEALDYSDGVFHLEAFEKNGNLYFLEIAARAGGGNGPALSLLGYDPLEAYVYSQLGKEPKINLNNKMMINYTLQLPKNISISKKLKVLKFKINLNKMKSYQRQISNILNKHKFINKNEELLNITFVGDNANKVKEEANTALSTTEIHLLSKGSNNDRCEILKVSKDGWKFKRINPRSKRAINFCK